MLSMISWKEFIVFIFFAVLIYYVIVVVLYYRNEFKLFLSGRLQNSARQFQSAVPLQTVAINQPQIQQERNETNYQPKVQDQEHSPNSQEEFNELLEQLQETIVHAGETKLVKQEILWSIKSLLREYIHVKSTDNIIAVNDFLILLAANQCSLELNEDDLSPLWNK